MFAGFVSGIPEFVAPSLEVDTVAELVEKTILSGESQVSVRTCPILLVPRSAALSPAHGRALKSWVVAHNHVNCPAYHRAVLRELHPARPCPPDLDLRRHPRVRVHTPISRVRSRNPAALARADAFRGAGDSYSCAKDAMGHVQTFRGGGKSIDRPDGAKSD